jgi:hypothetical protein
MGDIAPSPRPFNPIYAIKLGLVEAPIKKNDLDVLLTMPWSPNQA